MRTDPTEGFSFGRLRLYDYQLREIALVLNLLIIVLNCFALMIFTLEIYMNDQLIEHVATSSW